MLSDQNSCRAAAGSHGAGAERSPALAPTASDLKPEIGSSEEPKQNGLLESFSMGLISRKTKPRFEAYCSTCHPLVVDMSYMSM